jgi:hypothetical protein
VKTIEVPQLFALTHEADCEQVVGYGLVLPDGSTYSVAWPTQQGTAFYSTETAEQCAELRGADLLWIGSPPT